MNSCDDFGLDLLIDRFELLERRLEREIEREAPIDQVRATGEETDRALLHISAYQPDSAEGERTKFRFLLTKLVKCYPDLQSSEIVNALFAMCEREEAPRLAVHNRDG